MRARTPCSELGIPPLFARLNRVFVVRNNVEGLGISEQETECALVRKRPAD